MKSNLTLPTIKAVSVKLEAGSRVTSAVKSLPVRNILIWSSNIVKNDRNEAKVDGKIKEGRVYY